MPENHECGTRQVKDSAAIVTHCNSGVLSS
jgi:methylthioribose-1-phosphate isomerase